MLVRRDGGEGLLPDIQAPWAERTGGVQRASQAGLLGKLHGGAHGMGG